MKKLLGAVVTAILLSAGSASASTVTKITFSFKIDGTLHTCTMDVTRTNDSEKGYVANDILLQVKSDDCLFSGGGTIGKLDMDGLDSTRPSNIANVIAAGNEGNMHLLVLLKVTSDGQFNSGNGYYVYGWEDIAAFKFLGKGKYTVVE